MAQNKSLKSLMELLVKRLIELLVKRLAIPLSNHKTVAKWLVIAIRLVKQLVKRLAI